MRRPLLHATRLIFPAILMAGCSVFGIRSGYEQPSYDVIEVLDDSTEIRHYAPRVAAQLTLDADDPAASDNAAFRILAGYIFGDNRGSGEVAMTSPVVVEDGATIAMTAPVETATPSSGRNAMRFFLPADYTVADAPVPNDPRIEIIELPAAVLAVRRFSGLGRPTAVERRRGELEGLLAEG